MANYRHEVVEKGFIKESIREEGEVVGLSKPLDKPSRWLIPLDYEHVENEDGSFGIEYNKGVPAYRPGVEVVDDPEDDIDDKIKASEAAVKLADDMGIEIADVEGTGSDGAITKKDVQSYIDSLKVDPV